MLDTSSSLTTGSLPNVKKTKKVPKFYLNKIMDKNADKLGQSKYGFSLLNQNIVNQNKNTLKDTEMLKFLRKKKKWANLDLSDLSSSMSLR